MNVATVDDVAGTLYINSITFTGSGFSVSSSGGNSVSLAGGISVSASSGTNTLSIPITLYGATYHLISVAALTRLDITGVISGGPSDILVFGGNGTVQLSGDNTVASLSIGGSVNVPLLVLINGSQPTTPAKAYAGTVGGTGTSGPLEILGHCCPLTGNSNASLRPGPIDAPGILNVHGNVVIAGGLSGGNRFKVRANGPTHGADYDSLNVVGPVALQTTSGAGGTVQWYPKLDLIPGYIPAVGQSFTIIQATGGVTGNFDVGPDGSIFSAACLNFRVNYTSNSVIVTRVAGNGPPVTNVSIAVNGYRTVCSNTTGGTATVTDTGGCQNTHQWGYRSVSQGPITPIAGQTGSTYTIAGADFAAPGAYYLVCTTTPYGGSPVTSNEVDVTILPAPTAIASGTSTICPGQSTQLLGSGGTYCSWTPATGLSDPNSCNPIASPATTTTYSLVVSTGSCSSTNPASVTVFAGGPQGFYSLAPCRLIDTRNAAGPLGGPALVARTSRTFVATGSCAIPSTAQTISVNVTTTGPTAEGFLRFYPADQPLPLVSTVNFRAGQTRTNNALIDLACDGSGAFSVNNDAFGTVHLILDVNGYYK